MLDDSFLVSSTSTSSGSKRLYQRDVDGPALLSDTETVGTTDSPLFIRDQRAMEDMELGSMCGTGLASQAQQSFDTYLRHEPLQLQPFANNGYKGSQDFGLLFNKSMDPYKNNVSVSAPSPFSWMDIDFDKRERDNNYNNAYQLKEPITTASTHNSNPNPYPTYHRLPHSTTRTKTGALKLSPPARIRAYNSAQKRYEYECVFCRGNDQEEKVYKSHPIRLNEIIMCPFLRAHVCGICGSTGDNAHTVKYCPYNMRGFFATVAVQNSLSLQTSASSRSSSSISSGDAYKLRTDSASHPNPISIPGAGYNSISQNNNYPVKQPVVRKLNFDIPTNASESTAVFFKNLQQFQNIAMDKTSEKEKWGFQGFHG